MDIYCATCNEPWDSYHLLHHEFYETEAGIERINYQLAIEDLQKKGVLSEFWPQEPEIEKWNMELTPFWRKQFEKLGWEFGTSVVSVLRCPCCKLNKEHHNSYERRANIKMLSELLDGDIDGQISDNVLALDF